MPEEIQAPVPQPNTAEARTPDGTLRNQAETPDVTAAPAAPNPDTSVAPEAYAFTAPEGVTLDPKAIESVSPIFKELGLNQAQAQKLVDFYNTQTKAQSDQVSSAITAMREGWRNEIRGDAEIGSRIPEVQVEIGRALDKLGDQKLVKSFREAMDNTGMGDNPALVKTLFKFAKMVNEGNHVSGGGPSETGQAKPGAPARPTLAQAMYPQLPSR